MEGDKLVTITRVRSERSFEMTAQELVELARLILLYASTFAISGEEQELCLETALRAIQQAQELRPELKPAKEKADLPF